MLVNLFLEMPTVIYVADTQLAPCSWILAADPGQTLLWKVDMGRGLA